MVAVLFHRWIQVECAKKCALYAIGVEIIVDRSSFLKGRQFQWLRGGKSATHYVVVVGWLVGLNVRHEWKCSGQLNGWRMCVCLWMLGVSSRIKAVGSYFLCYQPTLLLSSFKSRILLWYVLYELNFYFIKSVINIQKLNHFNIQNVSHPFCYKFTTIYNDMSYY